jgi:hypothetical protein
MSSLGATVLPPVISMLQSSNQRTITDDNQLPGSTRAYNSPYKGEHLNRVAFRSGALEPACFAWKEPAQFPTCL